MNFKKFLVVFSLILTLFFVDTPKINAASVFGNVLSENIYLQQTTKVFSNIMCGFREMFGKSCFNVLNKNLTLGSNVEIIKDNNSEINVKYVSDITRSEVLGLIGKLKLELSDTVGQNNNKYNPDRINYLIQRNIENTLDSISESVGGGDTNFNGESLTVSGDIRANYFIGDGSRLTGISGGGGSGGISDLDDFDTDDLDQGSINKYFSDSLARSVFSTNAIGLSYSSSTGTLSLGSGYIIPTIASTTQWTNAALSNWSTNASNIYYNTGNVGIGTSTPTEKLSVAGNIDLTGALKLNGNAGTSGQILQSTGTGAQWVSTSTLGFISNLSTFTTDNLTEGLTNKYFSNTLSRSSISSSALGLSYSTTTGAFSLTSGYNIPTNASTTNWNTAYSWGNHSTQGYLTSISGLNISLLTNNSGYLTSYTETDSVFMNASSSFVRVSNNLSDLTSSSTARTNLGLGSLSLLSNLSTFTTDNLTEGLTNKYFSNTLSRSSISSSALGLSYSTTTGAFSLTSGYNIPTNASTTEWTNKVSSQWNTEGSNVYYSVGNVGIGTSTPSANLHVGSSATGVKEAVRIGNYATAAINNGAQILFQANRTSSGATSVAGVAGIITDIADSTYKGGLAFYTSDSAAPTERVRIDSKGNMGIGLSEPSSNERIALNGTSGYKIAFYNNTSFKSGMGLAFSDNNWAVGSKTDDIVFYNVNSSFLFSTDNSSNVALKISKTNGYIGIGTTTPTEKLSVAGNIDLTGALKLNGNAGTSGQILQSTGTGAQWVATSTLGISGGGSSQWTTSGADIYYTTGNIGIGTTTPTQALSVVGNIAMTGDIIPTSDDTYALGSLTHVWKDLFVGAGSIYVNGQKVLQTDLSDSVVVSSDDTQNLILKTTGGGNIELNSASGGGSILLKSNVLLTAGKSFRNSDSSAVSFLDGTQSGNLKLSSNLVEATNTNGGIEIKPNGIGITYFSSGNVGIGTSSPNSKLDVWGGLRVGTSSVSTLFVDNNISRVGINTINPTEALSVSGSVDLTGAIKFNGDAGNPGYVLQSTGSGSQWVATSTLGITGVANAFVNGGNSFGSVASIGTNDNYALTLESNNKQVAYFSPDGLSARFGLNAGLNATSTDIFIFGYEAGATTTSISGSNFIGRYSGRQATNANKSNFFGESSGLSATGANNSNFFGYAAGQLATGANNSNFFGSSAGRDGTSANNSNFFGANAGMSASSANNSNFFGSGAGSGAASAAESNFIGKNAGSSNTLASSAFNSNFFGASAGQNAQGAFHSNFFGKQAGEGSTNAYHSIFMGQYAGYNSVSANNSIFLGPEAGRQASNAANSYFIGYQAGYIATNAANSIFIGRSSGDSVVNNTTGNKYSILLGNYTSTGGFSNSIAIGQGAKNSAVDQLNLARVIYATNIGSSTTATSTPMSGSKVGIGTSTPGQTLTVVGNAQFTAVDSGAYAYDLNLTADGVLTTSASDIALKENIALLDSKDTLDKIMQLKPSSFDWKSNQRGDIGLIAQEVEVVFPELVFTNPSDNYKGINYSRFITYLISSVQELAKKVSDFGREVKTEKLCIGETCVTEDQLKQLLENKSVEEIIVNTGDGDIVTDENTDDITDDIIDENIVDIENGSEGEINDDSSSVLENSTENNSDLENSPIVEPEIENSNL